MSSGGVYIVVRLSPLRRRAQEASVGLRTSVRIERILTVFITTVTGVLGYFIFLGLAQTALL